MKRFTENNKVNPEFIKDQVSKLVFNVMVPEGTTTTVAVAFDEFGFQLAIGVSGCVDPANFDAEIGKQVACKNAETEAENKLWELYGFLLHKKMRS